MLEVVKATSNEVVASRSSASRPTSGGTSNSHHDPHAESVRSTPKNPSVEASRMQTHMEYKPLTPFEGNNIATRQGAPMEFKPSTGSTDRKSLLHPSVPQIPLARQNTFTPEKEDPCQWKVLQLEPLPFQTLIDGYRSTYDSY
jgi:hypothetical protein